MTEIVRTSIYKNLFLGLMIAYLASSLSPWWNLMPPLAILLFFTSGFNHHLKTSLQQLKSFQGAILIFSSLFFVGLLGMTYTTNKVDGWLDVILKSSLLLFPLTFAIFPKHLLQKQDVNRILNIYVIMVFGSSIYCFLNALIAYGGSAELSVFYYSQLSFFQHPSYFGLFINLALLIILNKWIQAKEGYGRKLKLTLYIMIPWMIVFLFLLQSKAALISLFIIIIFLFCCLILQKKLKKAFLFLVLIILTTAISSLVVPNSLVRFKSASNALNTETQSSNKKESTAARITLWSLASETILEGPIWGTGTGDVEQVYNDKLLLKGFIEPGEQAYNSHSQFLQTTMKLGVFGALALVLSLAYPLWQGYKKQNLVYVGMVLIMIFNLMVESMFERQAGLMFFAFFNSFLFFFSPEKEKK